jgi:hypothetical protein
MAPRTIKVDMATIIHQQHMELVLLEFIKAGLEADWLTASGVVEVALLDTLATVVAVGTVLDHTRTVFMDLVEAVAVQVLAARPAVRVVLEDMDKVVTVSDPLAPQVGGCRAVVDQVVSQDKALVMVKGVIMAVVVVIMAKVAMQLFR